MAASSSPLGSDSPKQDCLFVADILPKTTTEAIALEEGFNNACAKATMVIAEHSDDVLWAVCYLLFRNIDKQIKGMSLPYKVSKRLVDSVTFVLGLSVQNLFKEIMKDSKKEEEEDSEEASH